MTAGNQLPFEDRAFFETTNKDQHPCAKKETNLTPSELKQDYIDLIIVVQRHRKRTNYCLRQKNKKMQYKFGFPSQRTINSHHY